jgi:hypothetical protein
MMLAALAVASLPLASAGAPAAASGGRPAAGARGGRLPVGRNDRLLV